MLLISICLPTAVRLGLVTLLTYMTFSVQLWKRVWLLSTGSRQHPWPEHPTLSMDLVCAPVHGQLLQETLLALTARPGSLPRPDQPWRPRSGWHDPTMTCLAVDHRTWFAFQARPAAVSLVWFASDPTAVLCMKHLAVGCRTLSQPEFASQDRPAAGSQFWLASQTCKQFFLAHAN